MFGGQKNRIDLNLAVKLAKNREYAKADLKFNVTGRPRKNLGFLLGFLNVDLKLSFFHYLFLKFVDCIRTTKFPYPQTYKK